MFERPTTWTWCSSPSGAVLHWRSCGIPQRYAPAVVAWDCVRASLCFLFLRPLSVEWWLDSTCRAAKSAFDRQRIRENGTIYDLDVKKGCVSWSPHLKKHKLWMFFFAKVSVLKNEVISVTARVVDGELDQGRKPASLERPCPKMIATWHQCKRVACCIFRKDLIFVLPEPTWAGWIGRWKHTTWRWTKTIWKLRLLNTLASPRCFPGDVTARPFKAEPVTMRPQVIQWKSQWRYGKCIRGSWLKCFVSSWGLSQLPAQESHVDQETWAASGTGEIDGMKIWTEPWKRLRRRPALGLGIRWIGVVE